MSASSARLIVDRPALGAVADGLGMSGESSFVGGGGSLAASLCLS
jgi:hypothetical protein